MNIEICLNTCLEEIFHGDPSKKIMNVKKAGIIPYIKKEDKVLMLFMRPSDPKFGGLYWQIAKGGIDAGESAEAAARREGHEELGLRASNIDHMWPVGVTKNVKIYACEVYSMKDFDQPHYETGATQWMTAEEFERSGRDIHKSVVRAAVRKLTLLESFPELRTVIW